MARILLVDPQGWQGAVGGNRPFPNVGLAYLVPALRRAGHQVSLVDANNECVGADEFVARLRQQSPEIVGFSAKTSTIKPARDLAQCVKTALPEAHTVVGGPHTTVACASLSDEPAFDVVFVGEGETIFPELCDRLVQGVALDDLPGVLTHANIASSSPPNVPLLTDLDELAFPEYDLFPQNVREALSANYPLVTSRGCVYKCTYCSVPLVSGARFRKRSPENIVRELQLAHSKYGSVAFEIIDDTFNFDMARCKDFCRGLLDAGLNMAWSCPNGVRADRVDEELAELMFRSGCRTVMVGIESVVPEILQSVHKGETLDQIVTGIRHFQSAGITVGGFFIIGLPGDSYRAQEQAVKFAQEMNLIGQFSLLVPYPGTDLWQWAQKNAHFVENLEDAVHFSDTTSSARPVFETPDFSVASRRRAYEMVHTRMHRFEMVIPPNLTWLQRHWKLLVLLAKYDRRAFPGMLRTVLRDLLGKLWKRACRPFLRHPQ